MGRSVSVPSNAAAVIYFPVWDYDRDDDEEFDPFLAQMAFDDMVEELKAGLKSLEDSSFNDADRWLGREDHVFLENRIVDVTLSEYCGLCALAFVPKEEADEDAWWPIQEQWEEFAKKWASDFSERARKELSDGFDIYKKVGSFSNGEGVFERVS